MLAAGPVDDAVSLLTLLAAFPGDVHELKALGERRRRRTRGRRGRGRTAPRAPGSGERLTWLQVVLQGTWVQDTMWSCVALSVVLVQTQFWHLEYTGEPGLGHRAERVRQAPPRHPSQPAPRPSPRYRPRAVPSSPGIRHFHERTHPWALRRKKRELVSRTAQGGTGTEATGQERNQRPQRGATSPQRRPPASSRHNPPSFDRPGSGCPSCPSPLATYHTSRRGSTSRVPSRSSCQIPVDTQGASPCRGWHCTLEDREGHRDNEGAAGGPGPHGLPAAHWPPTPTLSWTHTPRPQQPLWLPSSGRR